MKNKLTVQEMILTLQKFWSSNGCMLMQAYDTEKGVGIDGLDFHHSVHQLDDEKVLRRQHSMVQVQWHVKTCKDSWF
jgi:glycyl-tRNA synthetase alpha subunit